MVTFNYIWIAAMFVLCAFNLYTVFRRNPPLIGRRHTAQRTMTMGKFDILVPHDRKVKIVMADGMLAQLLVTHTPSGFGYSVQTWDANLGYPPRHIAIEFA